MRGGRTDWSLVFVLRRLKVGEMSVLALLIREQERREGTKY